MRDIIRQIQPWYDSSEYVACATVIRLSGASPRGVGARMGFTLDGKITGSVSGGCVESAVIQAGFQVLKSGQPQHVHYGVVSERQWNTVGLACGGEVDVFIHRMDRVDCELARRMLAVHDSIYSMLIIEGPQELVGETIWVDPNELEDGLFFFKEGKAALERVIHSTDYFTNRVVQITRNGQEIKLFIEKHDPLPELIMVGGVHIAVALADFAKVVGYRTIVIDPRRAFINNDRFPNVDRLIQAWPQEAFSQINLNQTSAVAVLSHDPKIDDPALECALASKAFYIGALGSLATQKSRMERLVMKGFSQKDLQRIYGPIGLDIGGRKPEEIGLSIMSEIVSVANGKMMFTPRNVSGSILAMEPICETT